MKIFGKDITFGTKAKIAVTALVLAGCAFGGYSYYEAQQAEKAMRESAGETATVVRMEMKSTVSATGTIIPVDSVEVSSKITARIKNVLVKENDIVTAGETVATLDAKSLATKRDQAQFKVTNAKAKYDREAYLYSIGANPQSSFEDAQYNYDDAKSALEETESDLAETIIQAPISGIVVGKPKTAGTMATAGTDNPTVIMRIADLSKKQIMAKVDETDIGNIKIGQQATFTVDAHTGKTFTAHVTKISQTDTVNTWQTVSSSSATTTSSASVIYYYVTLDVDDPENLLLPAMTARLEIETATKPSALAVPIAALKTDSAGSYVVVEMPDGTKENRYVKTGIYSDDYVEILDGLMEGETVSISYTVSQTHGSKMGGGGHPPM